MKHTSLETQRYARWAASPSLAHIEKSRQRTDVSEQCRVVVYWLEWGGLKITDFEVSPKALHRLALYQLTRR